MAPKHPRQPVDLSPRNGAEFEASESDQPVEPTCHLHTEAMAERLAINSTNSSRPPSSDPPFGVGSGTLGPGGQAGDRGLEIAAAPAPANAFGSKPGRRLIKPGE